jgi:hypothetical protein
MTELRCEVRRQLPDVRVAISGYATTGAWVCAAVGGFDGSAVADSNTKVARGDAKERILSTGPVHLLPACVGPSTLLPAKALIKNRLANGIPLAYPPGMQVPRSADICVAKITGQGLTSIAILVALLWTCLVGERVILGRANADASQVIRAMRELQLKSRQQPAASPARMPRRRPRTEAG